ncbi:MAG: hypothetical protein M3Z92_04135, partial [Bacteroidota bacterium]|nr:hypothetical protein [Bacteroidota bacterium]
LVISKRLLYGIPIIIIKDYFDGFLAIFIFKRYFPAWLKYSRVPVVIAIKFNLYPWQLSVPSNIINANDHYCLLPKSCLMGIEK